MPSVQDLLTDLQRSSAPATKTASEAPTSNVDDARTALQQQLAAATTPPQPKTAADNSVQGASAIQELTKIASELADADEAAQIKVAQLYGAAAADGFIQRMNQYAANAPQAQKVAEVQPVHGDAQNAALTKMASALGALEAENAILRLSHGAQQQPPVDDLSTKTAAEQDAAGVWAAAEKVAAASEDCFIRGYEAMDKIAQALI